MKLSSRFVLDALFLVAAAFLTVAAMTWTIGVAHRVAFAVSVGILVIAGLSAVLAQTGGRKIGHSVIGLAAAWSVIAALVFSGTALTWLVFADAILVGVLALGDLTAHEATTENVVHRLEVLDGAAAESGSPPDGAIAREPAQPGSGGVAARPAGAAATSSPHSRGASRPQYSPGWPCGAGWSGCRRGRGGLRIVAKASTPPAAHAIAAMITAFRNPCVSSAGCR